MEVNGQSRAPAALLPEKEPRYPLDNRLDAVKIKKSLPLPGLEPRLSYPGSPCVNEHVVKHNTEGTE